MAVRLQKTWRIVKWLAGGLAGNLSPWRGLETNPPPPVHAPEAGAKRAGRAMLGLEIGVGGRIGATLSVPDYWRRFLAAGYQDTIWQAGICGVRWFESQV